jgi:hypothetical protein
MVCFLQLAAAGRRQRRTAHTWAAESSNTHTSCAVDESRHEKRSLAAWRTCEIGECRCAGLGDGSSRTFCSFQRISMTDSPVTCGMVLEWLSMTPRAVVLLHFHRRERCWAGYMCSPAGFTIRWGRVYFSFELMGPSLLRPRSLK